MLINYLSCLDNLHCANGISLIQKLVTHVCNAICRMLLFPNQMALLHFCTCQTIIYRKNTRLTCGHGHPKVFRNGFFSGFMFGTIFTESS